MHNNKKIDGIDEFWKRKEEQRMLFYNQENTTPESLQEQASFFHGRLEGFIITEPNGKKFSVSTLKPVDGK